LTKNISDGLLGLELMKYVVTNIGNDGTCQSFINVSSLALASWVPVL